MHCAWLASEVNNSRFYGGLKSFGGDKPHYPQGKTTPKYQSIVDTDPLVGHISVHVHCKSM